MGTGECKYAIKINHRNIVVMIWADGDFTIKTENPLRKSELEEVMCIIHAIVPQNNG